MASEIKMKWGFLLLFYCVPLPSPLDRTGLIVWNVGQGQFVTLNLLEACLHFDMGGEEFPRAVASVCRHKKNYFYLSHWDWDHIGFVQRAQRLLPDSCLAKGPTGFSRH